MTKFSDRPECPNCGKKVMLDYAYCTHCQTDLPEMQTPAKPKSQLSKLSSNFKQQSRGKKILLIVGCVLIVDLVAVALNPGILDNSLSSISSSSSSEGPTRQTICTKIVGLANRAVVISNAYTTGEIDARTASLQYSALTKDVDSYRKSLNAEFGSTDWGYLENFFNILVDLPNGLYLASNSLIDGSDMYNYWVDVLNETIGEINSACA